MQPPYPGVLGENVHTEVTNPTYVKPCNKVYVKLKLKCSQLCAISFPKSQTLNANFHGIFK